MNDKIKTIYFHVGMHKTATTSIQETFYNNEDLLKANGFYYFTREGKISANQLNSVFNEKPEKIYNNVKKNRDRNACIEFNNKFMRFIENGINNTKCENVIFSAENISNMTQRNIKKMMDYFMDLMPKAKIVIVISTRENVSFINSMHQQMIKSGPGKEKNFDEFFNPSKTTEIYRKRIEKFINILGRESLLIYKFEDAVKHEYGPVGYMLMKMGVSDDEISKFNINKGNESLTDRSMDILTYLHETLPLTDHYIISKGRFVGDSVKLTKISGEKYYLPLYLQKKYDELEKKDEIWLKENTGIDYTNGKKIVEPKKMIFDETYEKEMENIFLEGVSPVIQKILYKYFEEKLNLSDLDSDSKNILKNLIEFADDNLNKNVLDKSLDEIIMECDEQKEDYRIKINNFVNKIKKYDITKEKKENVNESYYLRNLAFLCKSFGQFETAAFFMGIAKDFCPEDEKVIKRYKEFKERAEGEIKQEKNNIDIDKEFESLFKEQLSAFATKQEVENVVKDIMDKKENKYKRFLKEKGVFGVIKKVLGKK